MSDCERWVALSDRDAVGEGLAREEREFLLVHARDCNECGAEADVWRALERTCVPEESPPPARVQSTRLRAVAVLFVAAAAAILVAAGARTWMRAPDRPAGPPAGSASLAARSAEATTCVGFVSGDVDVDDREPVVGAPLSRGAVVSTRAGSTCLVVDQGVRACLSPRSRVRIVETARPDRRLEVLAGKVVAELEPQPPGTTFTLEARDGTATAIGTAFSVEVLEGDAPSVTRVLHGTVLVRPRGAPEKRVGAHAQAAMTRAPPTPLAVADEARDIGVLVPAMETDAPQSAVARVESDPAGATVRIDDRVAGTTPLAILLDPGEHAIVVETERASLRDVVRLGPGGRAPPVRSRSRPRP
jgi:ferric-dicitrate binding protein FerR (iron transport regulator)